MRTINRDRQENIVNKETRQKRYSQIKHVRESIVGKPGKTNIDVIQNAAEAINARIIKDMGIDDLDFVIQYTPLGLWITWDSNNHYGIKVCSSSDGYFVIESFQDHDSISIIKMTPALHPSRIASAVMQIVNEDGYLD